MQFLVEKLTSTWVESYPLSDLPECLPVLCRDTERKQFSRKTEQSIDGKIWVPSPGPPLIS